jgi:hypothetical protein
MPDFELGERNAREVDAATTVNADARVLLERVRWALYGQGLVGKGYRNLTMSSPENTRLRYSGGSISRMTRARLCGKLDNRALCIRSTSYLHVFFWHAAWGLSRRATSAA